jgi:TPR repeat protein
MNSLGVAYETEGHDEKQAIIWYCKAAQLGDTNAKNTLKRLGESP